MATGQFNGVLHVQDNNGRYLGDTTIKRPLTTMGFGGSIGLSLPIKGTGHISCWAVAAQLMFNTYSWTDLNQTYSPDGSFKAPTSKSVSVNTTQIALPLGIDYKIGHEAILSKRLLLGASMGAGIIPQLDMTSVQNADGFDPNYRFGVTPYAKVEGSIFAGMCIKVRAMYTIGNLSLIDVNRRISQPVNDGPFNVTMQSNLIVSLFIMPWSTKWSETSWWNTYDTYNQHDRFN